ncbi:SprT-like protein [Paenibacillus naphthalenovorans]|uniref:SprT-like protein n=1 Tax=Paenibacillus naphthalenovorans TaxID=162209 RepID=A0A0U2W117_9BACL|nr:SprT-like protein [Paenibacillus naphthalenovorans]
MILTRELTPNLEYLEKLSNIIQKDGLRDPWIIQDRLKQLNRQDDTDVVVFDSYNEKGKCIVYYGVKPDLSVIYAYEFKLGKVLKEYKIENILELDKWKQNFDSVIRYSMITLDDIKNDVLQWVEKYKTRQSRAYKQFIDTLKVYRHYTGQIIVYYKEMNGENKKLKPIVRKYKSISLDDLIEFGKKKSKELWNREFTCKVVFVKAYWNSQLGVYYPHKETIAFSEYMCATMTEDQIYDTMLHEMVHWHLHTSGRNYHDEDFEFIEECLKVGCGLSQSNSARKAYIQYQKSV